MTKLRMQRMLLLCCAQPLTRLPELSTLKMSHLNCRSNSQRAQNVLVLSAGHMLKLGLRCQQCRLGVLLLDDSCAESYEPF